MREVRTSITGIPDHESLFPVETEYDWSQTVYDRVDDSLPPNAPPPKGEPV